MEVGSRPLAERGSWPSDALGGVSCRHGLRDENLERTLRMGSSPDVADVYTCRRTGIWGIYMMDIVRGYCYYYSTASWS